MKKLPLFTQIRWWSLFGIALAIYLLWQQSGTTSFHPCSINRTINCDAVISGPVAKTFGIATPLYGLTGFVILLIGSFAKWRRVSLGVATFGMLFCIRLMVIEIFSLHVICPVCIACQIVMAMVWWLSWRLVREKTTTGHVSSL